MAKFNIEGKVEFTLSFNPDSPDFIRALTDYRDAIYRKGDTRSLLVHVAASIVQFGIEHVVEGVGYVLVEGQQLRVNSPYDFSGIYASEDHDIFGFEISKIK